MCPNKVMNWINFIYIYILSTRYTSSRYGQWFDKIIKLFISLWPSDAIWHNKTWSTLVQVMARCLTARSHYLNQCWLIVSEVLWHSLRRVHSKYSDISYWDLFKYHAAKIITSFSQASLAELNCNENRWPSTNTELHYNDVIMGTIASQITRLTIVYSTVYSDADQRKYQSSASLAFVRGIHRRPVNTPHKWPVTRKIFPFDDVIMDFSCTMILKKICFSLLLLQCFKLSWPRWHKAYMNLPFIQRNQRVTDVSTSLEHRLFHDCSVTSELEDMTHATLLS